MTRTKLINHNAPFGLNQNWNTTRAMTKIMANTSKNIHAPENVLNAAPSLKILVSERKCGMRTISCPSVRYLPTKYLDSKSIVTRTAIIPKPIMCHIYVLKNFFISKLYYNHVVLPKNKWIFLRGKFFFYKFYIFSAKSCSSHARYTQAYLTG